MVSSKVVKNLAFAIVNHRTTKIVTLSNYKDAMELASSVNGLCKAFFGKYLKRRPMWWKIHEHDGGADLIVSTSC